MPIHEHSRTVSRAADNSWVWKVDFVIWLFRRASGARDYARKSKPRRKRGHARTGRVPTAQACPCSRRPREGRRERRTRENGSFFYCACAQSARLRLHEQIEIRKPGTRNVRLAHQAQTVVPERQILDHHEDILEELGEDRGEGGDCGQGAFVISRGGATAQGLLESSISVEHTLFTRVNFGLNARGRDQLAGRRVLGD